VKKETQLLIAKIEVWNMALFTSQLCHNELGFTTEV